MTFFDSGQLSITASIPRVGVQGLLTIRRTTKGDYQHVGIRLAQDGAASIPFIPGIANQRINSGFSVVAFASPPHKKIPSTSQVPARIPPRTAGIVITMRTVGYCAAQ